MRPSATAGERSLAGIKGGIVRLDIGLRQPCGVVGHWPLEPMTAFYDWLYLCALRESPNLAEQILEFEAFSDIEFNPKKSVNCQAEAAAVYKSLAIRGMVSEALSSMERFLSVHRVETRSAPSSQPRLL